ncbi:caldesmon-like [Aplysia californica]|uniref:Caldesmon-like n=1 Tax=Aplysia californica TaxID=6500 RepID=A0ABM0ZYQ4_APLCA|nr:caldesmon-like [Aplysia californica]
MNININLRQKRRSFSQWWRLASKSTRIERTREEREEQKMEGYIIPKKKTSNNDPYGLYSTLSKEEARREREKIARLSREAWERAQKKDYADVENKTSVKRKSTHESSSSSKRFRSSHSQSFVNHDNRWKHSLPISATETYLESAKPPKKPIVRHANKKGVPPPMDFKTVLAMAEETQRERVRPTAAISRNKIGKTQRPNAEKERKMQRSKVVEEGKRRKPKAEEEGKRQRSKAGEEGKRQRSKAEEEGKRRRPKAEEEGKRHSSKAEEEGKRHSSKTEEEEKRQRRKAEEEEKKEKTKSVECRRLLKFCGDKPLRQRDGSDDGAAAPSGTSQTRTSTPSSCSSRDKSQSSTESQYVTGVGTESPNNNSCSKRSNGGHSSSRKIRNNRNSNIKKNCSINNDNDNNNIGSCNNDKSKNNSNNNKLSASKRKALSVCGRSGVDEVKEATTPSSPQNSVNPLDETTSHVHEKPHTQLQTAKSTRIERTREEREEQKMEGYRIPKKKTSNNDPYGLYSTLSKEEARREREKIARLSREAWERAQKKDYADVENKTSVKRKSTHESRSSSSKRFRSSHSQSFVNHDNRWKHSLSPISATETYLEPAKPPKKPIVRHANKNGVPPPMDFKTVLAMAEETQRERVRPTAAISRNKIGKTQRPNAEKERKMQRSKVVEEGKRRKPKAEEEGKRQRSKAEEEGKRRRPKAEEEGKRHSSKAEEEGKRHSSKAEEEENRQEGKRQRRKAGEEEKRQRRKAEEEEKKEKTKSVECRRLLKSGGDKPLRQRDGSDDGAAAPSGTSQTRTSTPSSCSSRDKSQSSTGSQSVTGVGAESPNNNSCSKRSNGGHSSSRKIRNNRNSNIKKNRSINNDNNNNNNNNNNIGSCNNDKSKNNSNNNKLGASKRKALSVCGRSGVDEVKEATTPSSPQNSVNPLDETTSHVQEKPHTHLQTDPGEQIEVPGDHSDAVQDLNIDVPIAGESVEEFVYGDLKDWISQELRKMCCFDGSGSKGDSTEDDVSSMETDPSNLL